MDDLPEESLERYPPAWADYDWAGYDQDDFDTYVKGACLTTKNRITLGSQKKIS